MFDDKFFSRGTWGFLLFIRTSYVDGVKMANVGIFFDSGGVQSNSSSSNKLRVLGDKRKSISIFSSNRSNPLILNRLYQILEFSFSVWVWTFLWESVLLNQKGCVKVKKCCCHQCSAIDFCSEKSVFKWKKQWQLPFFCWHKI